MNYDLTRLHNLLRYEPDTGHIIWRANHYRRKAGNRAGTLNKNGYRYLMVDRKNWREHRLAFLLYYGYLPKELDHINGNPADNRIKNLRPATRSLNNANMRTENKTGFKGVYYAKDQGSRCWCARVWKNRKVVFVEYFKTPEEAARAYDRAAIKYHGEFAKTNESMGLLS